MPEGSPYYKTQKNQQTGETRQMVTYDRGQSWEPADDAPSDLMFRTQRNPQTGELRQLVSTDGESWEQSGMSLPPAPDLDAPPAAPPTPPDAQPDRTSMLEAAGRGGLQGASVGFADEAAGAGAAIHDALSRFGQLLSRDEGFARHGRLLSGEDGGVSPNARVPRGRTGFDPGNVREVSGYEAQRDRYRDEDRAAREQHPVTFGASEVGGALGTAAAPITKAAGAARPAQAAAPATRGARFAQGARQLGQRAKQVAPPAAAWGALAGYGTSEEEGLAGQAADTAVGAGLGAATGVAGSEAARAATRLLGRLPQSVLARIPLLGSEAQTARKVREIETQHGKAVADDVRRMLSDTPEGAEMRRLVTLGESPERVSQLAAETAEDTSEVLRGGSRIMNEETIGKKIGQAKRYMQEDAVDPARTSEQIDALVAGAREQIEEGLSKLHKSTPDHTLLRNVEKQLAEYDMAVQGLGGSPRVPTEEFRLSDFARGASDLDTSPLDPRSGPRPIIEDGSDIIDGYHRIAGYAKWAEEHGVPLEDVRFSAINVPSSDDQVSSLASVAANAENPTAQRQAIEEIESLAAQKAPTLDAAATRWGQLDQVKREIQKAVKSASRRGMNSPEIEGLRRLADDLTAKLEDPALAGAGSAANQVQRNRAWSTDLPEWQGRDQSPSRAFLTDASAERALEDPYRLQLEGDPRKIRSLMQTAETEPAFVDADPLAKLGRVLDKRANLGDKLTDHIDPDPAYREVSADMRTRADRVAERITQRRTEAEAAQRLQAAERPLQREQSPVGAVAMVANPKAGLARELAGALKAAPPGQRIRELGRLEQQAPNNELAQKALDRAFRRPIEAPRLQQATGIATTRATPSMEGAVSTALAQGSPEIEPYRDRLERAKEDGRLQAELFKLNSDPTWRLQVAPQLLEQ